jgi:hypothetical protein
MQDKAAQIMQIERFLQRTIKEAENHQQPWIDLAGEIYDLIDGRVETTNETEVHINMVGTAYERIKAELTRGLTNFDKWLVVEQSVGNLSKFMTPLEANRLVMLGLDGSNPRTAVVDMLGTMLVENRSGLKLHSWIEELPGQKKSFKIKWVPLSFNNYLVDPADPVNPLYECFTCYMPKFKALRLPKVWQEAIKNLKGYVADNESLRLSNEGDIDGTVQSSKSTRHDLRIIEWWGTVLDDNGNVMMWDDMPLENVQILCANNGTMIADPLPNKRYSGASPFTVAPLLRSAKTPYRPGLLANGAEMNKYTDTLVSALVLGGIKACHGVTTVNSQWLKDPEVVANGLLPNMTLEANDEKPLGAKLFEVERIGDLPSSGLQLYQLLRQLTGENMFASDQFMTGNSRSSDTATAQIQSQNVIGGLFEALDAVLEDEIIETIAQETFQEMLRNRKYISDENLLWVFSGDEERAITFKEMPEGDLLKLLATAFKFRGKGLRSRAASKGKAAAYTQFASMLMSNPIMSQQFNDAFSFKTFISKGLEGLEIDPEELSLTERELDLIMWRKMAEAKAMAEAQAQGAMGQDPGMANAVQGAPSELPVGAQEGQNF